MFLAFYDKIKEIFFKTIKMDFKTLKQKAFELKDKAIEFTEKTIETSAQKLWESSVVLKNDIELQDFVLKSENKDYITKEWVSKINIKRVLVVFWDWKKDFFKSMLLYLPVLLTKSFSQNLSLKLVDINNEDIDLKKYDLKEFPSLIVFENKEIYKVILWEENIKKVVKSLSLDINETIEKI